MPSDKYRPYGFRLGYNKDWHSHWSVKKQYGDYLLEDLKLKAQMKGRFAGAGVSHVDIERAADRLKLIIYTSRPGIIIGRKGAEIDKLKAEIASRTGKEVLVSIQEIHRPELNAQLQAEKIASQLEKRIAFRRALRKTVEETLRFGGQGIKVKVAGRLNGAEIARTEWHLQGRLPLHTLRADIDYGFAEAHTTFGVIGVKVWIYRGEILDPKAAMARGTQPDPINELRPERGDGRRPRRDREGYDRSRGPRSDRGGGRDYGGFLARGGTTPHTTRPSSINEAEPDIRYAEQIHSVDDPYYDASSERIVKTLKKQGAVSKARIRSAVRAVCMGESETVPE